MVFAVWDGRLSPNFPGEDRAPLPPGEDPWPFPSQLGEVIHSRFCPFVGPGSSPPLARFSPRIGNYGEGMTLSTNKSTNIRPRTAQAQPAGATGEPTGTIVCVLSEVMGRHRISQTALAQACGLRPATIHALYHDRTSR